MRTPQKVVPVTDFLHPTHSEKKRTGENNPFEVQKRKKSRTGVLRRTKIRKFPITDREGRHFVISE
jgi:hypothetical protein